MTSSGRGRLRRVTATGVAAAGVAVAGTAAVGVAALRKDDLTGEVALVAGASRGLGLLIARELARQGARVAICARDRQELGRAREQLDGEGLQVETFVCDVTDGEQVHRLVGEVEQRLGPVDVLVNVAGIIQVAPDETLTDADYEAAMATMFWGPFRLTRAVLPSMRRRRHGRIATVTSVGGAIGVPHLLPYSAAKFAAVGWFEGLRAELAGSGITVTTIVPGLMRTGSHLNASFGGQSDLEYAWFAVGAAAPLVAMDAERAARRMVGAIRQRRRVLLLTPLSKVATRVHGVAPSSTVALLEVMGRLLPGPGAGGGRPEGLVTGRAADVDLDSSVLRRVTGWGRDAARRFNEGEAPG
ncbi:MAG TPA: SDR family NAD(P)-dependent oxidoreductase [Segeticoccus sp.]|nr:SDR family NAD(P)-dependent oxidoreductase [Segeticoccus sp.]